MVNRYDGLSTPKPAILAGAISRPSPMRLTVAALLGALLLPSCSKPPPPVGHWEGTYQSQSTFIAVRLELAAGPTARISVADATDPSIDKEEDRAAMEQNLADRVAGAWGEIAPTRLAFDGTTFRKLGGTAPLIVWDSSTNTMTLYVYLGAQIAVPVAIRPVSDFSANPWPRRAAHLANEKYAAATRHANAAM